jgi:hypothetical protein
VGDRFGSLNVPSLLLLHPKPFNLYRRWASWYLLPSVWSGENVCHLGFGQGLVVTLGQ